MHRLCLLACALSAFAQTPVFKTDTALQSIAVQVIDKQGEPVKGLTAGDFSLLENGRTQKVAFFGAEKRPTSLTVLIDLSPSMNFDGKLDRAGAILGSLLRGNHPEDEVLLVPFTDHIQPLGRISPFTALTMDQRLHPPDLKVASTGGGTALYDALASALCHIRSAQNVQQAIVVITDGADQNSRLKLQQLIQLTRSSNAQIFTIGFFGKSECDTFRESGKTVTLIGEREIDNPVVVFERLAKESGAESFFPSSEHSLEQALGRISTILQAQYTLSYYPVDASRYRRIEVRLKREGMRALSRDSVGAETIDDVANFRASSCQVAAKDYPYPWESRTTRDASGALTWREDFSDPRSGWPNRRERLPVQRSVRNLESELRSGRVSDADVRNGGSVEGKAGLHYVSTGYELSLPNAANAVVTGPRAGGVIVAQGPFWENFRASVLIEANLGNVSRLTDYFTTAPGLIFHLGSAGYYALLLSGGGHAGTRYEGYAVGRDGTPKTVTGRPIINGISFMLVRKNISSGSETVILPWKKIASDAGKKRWKLSVQYNQGQVEILVDDQLVANVHDTTFPNGLIGFALFGHGRAVFHDLIVEQQTQTHD